MAKQIIDIGTVPNDRTGDPLRTAFDKCNDNFDELYANSGGGSITLDPNIMFGSNGNGVYAATIGTEGDFATIKEAIDFLGTKPVSGPGLVAAEFELIAGVTAGYAAESNIYFPSLGYDVVLNGSLNVTDPLDFLSGYIVIQGTYLFDTIDLSASEILVIGGDFSAIDSVLNCDISTGSPARQESPGRVLLEDVFVENGYIDISNGGYFNAENDLTMSPGYGCSFYNCFVYLEDPYLNDNYLEFYNGARAFIKDLHIDLTSVFDTDILVIEGSVVHIEDLFGFPPSYSQTINEVNIYESGSAIWVNQIIQ